MSRWHRVFGRVERRPAPETVERLLQEAGVEARPRFRGDERGWTSVEFDLAPDASPLVLDCFSADDPEVRAELQAWAAELETCDYSPNNVLLMERVIQTRHWFTLRRPLDHADEARLDRVCERLCRGLARETDGVHQCDAQGWFADDGVLLLQEY